MPTVKLIHDEETDELVLPLDDDVFKAVGWEIGDTIQWIDNGDGTWTLKKKDDN